MEAKIQYFRILLVILFVLVFKGKIIKVKTKIKNNIII